MTTSVFGVDEWHAERRARDREQHPLPVAHLSPSSLNMFLRCPEQFRRRYVLGHKEPPTFNLTLGSSVHITHEHTLGVKIDKGELPTIGEVRDYFHDHAWPQAVERSGGEGEIVWSGNHPDYVRRNGESMVEVYTEAVIPSIDPQAVEQEMAVKLPDFLEVPIVGVIDVIQKDSVIDFKTSTRAAKKVSGKWRMQARVYALMSDTPAEFHISTYSKTGAVACYTPLDYPDLRIKWNEQIKNQTIAEIASIADTIRMFHAKWPEGPWPLMGTFHDICGWCGYAKTCPAGKGTYGP